MRPDWEVKTNYQAVAFLSRAFRHQFQREVPHVETNPTLEVIVDAQSACLNAWLSEAA